ncbi:MAG: hypothetical protein M1817_006006 [Caeruleum heppii]|nr:MAG: hypothetical protein M1817_006006 [Caeruleum heppii]
MSSTATTTTTLVDFDSTRYNNNNSHPPSTASSTSLPTSTTLTTSSNSASVVSRLSTLSGSSKPIPAVPGLIYQDLKDRRRSLPFSISSRSSGEMPRQRNKALDSDTSADETTAIVGRKVGTSGAGGYGSAGNVRSRHDAPDERPSEQNDAERKVGWIRGFVDRYGSVELENKGSVARDHLALERTFLAWLRTSLAFASIGIAITQLFRLNTTISSRDLSDSDDDDSSHTTPFPSSHPDFPGSPIYSPRGTASGVRLRHVGKPLGATFLAIAIMVLFVGFHRYFESQHWIIRGKFPASRGSVFLIAVTAAGLIIGSLVVVLTVDPGAFEK